MAAQMAVRTMTTLEKEIWYWKSWFNTPLKTLLGLLSVYLKNVSLLEKIYKKT